MSEMDPAAACLPEGVVAESLARVPDVVSLFRSAVVCKLWRSLVADPAFLGRFSSDDPTSLVWRTLLPFVDEFYECRVAAVSGGTAQWLFHGDPDGNGQDEPSLCILGVSSRGGQHNIAPLRHPSGRVHCVVVQQGRRKILFSCCKEQHT